MRYFIIQSVKLEQLTLLIRHYLFHYWLVWLVFRILQIQILISSLFPALGFPCHNFYCCSKESRNLGAKQLLWNVVPFHIRISLGSKG